MNNNTILIPKGILPLKKESGMTSHDCVGIMRRLYNTRAVGHTGTLDPMAEGVLLIMIGRATKLERFLSADSKDYTAGLRLGLETDTEDTTGEVLRESDVIPSEGAVLEAISSFVGDILQYPPMYSAVKIGGKKLYEYAREGQTVERKPRNVTVFSANGHVSESERDYKVNFSVSSGTYIRTLCADIGKKLGCGGAMSSLTRTRSGKFELDNCYTLDEIRNATYEERLSFLIPPENALDGEHLTLPPFFERLYLSGCEIYQKKIGTCFPVGAKILVFSAGGDFLSLGTVRDFKDGTAIKSEIIM